MKGVLVGLAALAFWCGGATAGPTSSSATLSFSIDAGVSDYDGFVGPLGGGICLGRARVTDPKDDAGASWSPDGRRVAFYRRTGPLTAEVFVADANGHHLRNLSRRSATFNWAPTWAPDGSRVVYKASDRDRDQLMSVRSDGSDLRPVPNTAYPSQMQLGPADVSPDGRWIGYTLEDPAGRIR